MKLGRWLVMAGALLLILGGMLHSYGYRFIEPKLASALASQPELLGVFKAMWWAFGAQFIVIGLVVLTAVRSSAGRGIILLCALISGITCLLMIHYVGVFIGSIMFAIVCVLLLIGAFLMPRSRESHPASRMW